MHAPVCTFVSSAFIFYLKKEVISFSCLLRGLMPPQPKARTLFLFAAYTENRFTIQKSCFFT